MTTKLNKVPTGENPYREGRCWRKRQDTDKGLVMCQNVGRKRLVRRIQGEMSTEMWLCDYCVLYMEKCGYVITKVPVPSTSPKL